MPAASTKSMVSKGEVSPTSRSHSSLVAMAAVSGASDASAAMVSMSFWVFCMNVPTSFAVWLAASATYWLVWDTMRLLVCCMNMENVTTTAMKTTRKAATDSQYFLPSFSIGTPSGSRFPQQSFPQQIMILDGAGARERDFPEAPECHRTFRQISLYIPQTRTIIQSIGKAAGLAGEHERAYGKRGDEP